MARLTLDDLRAACNATTRAKNPGLFPAGDRPPAAKLEPRAEPRPLAASPAQARDTRKRLVLVVSYRTRLLDEDNLAAKFHVDSLRYAGILLGDDPTQARIQVSQQKVGTKKEERTEITVAICSTGPPEPS